jgi:hypothetical protein
MYGCHLPPPFSACLAVVESPARKKAGGFADLTSAPGDGAAAVVFARSVREAKNTVPDEKSMLACT